LRTKKKTASTPDLKGAVGLKSHVDSATLMLLVLMAAIGALVYASFLFNPANKGDIVPYILVIVAESFIIFQALVALWTMLASTYDPRSYKFHAVQDHIFSLEGKRKRYNSVYHDSEYEPNSLPLYMHHKQVTIDVFITVYGEPVDVIEKTASAAREMTGQHRTFILDDGSSDEVLALAKRLRVGYIRRKDNKHAKAGNINHALKLTKADFFAVFDADFVPQHNFLYETVPFFEDDAMAFVQTPQYYRNADNLISRGAGFMQAVFYKLVMTGKNRFNSAFCVGTNVLFRRAAVESVGGIYTGSKSEDIWTALKLHENGYKSVFIPDVLAVGATPDSIKTYSKQQLRWATGGFEIFLRRNPLFIKGLSVDQKIQYLSTSAYYFHAFAVMFLLILPPLHIFFNLTAVDLNLPLEQWAFYYAAFYLMQIAVAFYTMGGFRYETLVLGIVSFPIYVKAFFNALRKKDESWVATGTVSGLESPFGYMIPQLSILMFLVAASGVGIWKAYYYETISISLLWCLLNTVIFGSFFLFALREHRHAKKINKAERTERRRLIAQET